MAKALLHFITLLLIVSFSCLSDAKAVQDDWVYPMAPDFTASLKVGDTYTLKWTSDLWKWFGVFAPSIDVSNADLWITGYDLHQYQHLVAARVNVNNTRYSLTWKLQLPADELDATDSWVFRFVPSGVVPLSVSQQISSPGFSILPAPQATTTSISVSSSSTSNSSILATSTPAIISGISSAIPASRTANSSGNSSSSHGLSGGALGGIVVGTIIGTAALIALGWYIVRLKKRSINTNNTPVESDGIRDSRVYPEVAPRPEKSQHSMTQQYVPQRVDQSGWDHPHANLHELGQSRTPRLPAELDDTTSSIRYR